MNDEMREAFEADLSWGGAAPARHPLDNYNYEDNDIQYQWKGFQAAYQLQQKKIDELELKLELRQAAYDMDNRLGKENEEIQTKLDKAVSALEEVVAAYNRQTLLPLDDCDVGDYEGTSLYQKDLAQQTLLEIKESK